MELINTNDQFQLQPRMKYFGGAAFTNFLMHLLRMKKVNKLYTELAKEEGIEFIDKLIKTLDLKYEFDETQLKKIPSSGAFITVSNHPFGGLDGILLIKILSQIRPEIKFLPNDFFKKI